MSRETVEEAAKRLYPHIEGEETLNAQNTEGRIDFIAGAEWQAERMYSEEEVKQLLNATLIEYSDFVLADIPKWFEQFKKK